MRLYIVRHAKAADLPFASMSCAGVFAGHAQANADFKRPLTDRGRVQAQFLARWVACSDRKPNLILASGAARTQETAEFLREAAACEVRTERALAVDRPVSEVLEIIQANAQVRTLMLVGHNPQLGELLGVLACGLPPQQLTMRTGDLVGLDIRATDPIGSARIAERQRLDDAPGPDESALGAMVLEARRPAGAR